MRLEKSANNSDFDIEKALLKIQSRLDVHSRDIKQLKENFIKLSGSLSFIYGELFKLKQKVDEIDARTINFPQLYNNVDALVGEIKENREERALMNSRITNLEQRCLKFHGEP